MADLSSYRDQHFKVGNFEKQRDQNFKLSTFVKFQGSRHEQEYLLSISCTLYVGNMSFYTTEEQLYELFGKCGEVKRIVMGLDKFKR